MPDPHLIISDGGWLVRMVALDDGVVLRRRADVTAPAAAAIAVVQTRRVANTVAVRPRAGDVILAVVRVR